MEFATRALVVATLRVAARGFAWGGLLALAACSRSGLEVGLDAHLRQNPAQNLDAEAARALCSRPVPLETSSRIMFVLDRSGSMAARFGLFGDGDGTDRWEQVTDTLARAIEAVPDTLHIGGKLFPSGMYGDCTHRRTPDECEVWPNVELSPAPGNGPRLVEIMRRVEPCGATPLDAAVVAAAEELDRTGRPGQPATMIVITDGAPNCRGASLVCWCARRDAECIARSCIDTEESARALAAARDRGIPSYVVGVAIDRGEAYQSSLARLALAGGLPRREPSTPYYDVGDPDELSHALFALIAGVRSCELRLLARPAFAGSITVLLGGRTLPRDRAREDGWDWTGYLDITLYGDACERAQIEPAAVVESCE